MALIRNLEEAEMTLLVKNGEIRTPSGSVKDNWEIFQKIKVQISTTTVNKIVDSVKYSEINYLGVTRGLEKLPRCKFMLQDKNGLYELLDVKKIGPRTIIRFKAYEGDNNVSRQPRI